MDANENVWTLMIFENGQSQAVVLQYKGRDFARRDRDILNAATPEKVTICDDFGRELTFRPMNVQSTLIQDIDKATEANLIVTIKNNSCQMLAQVLAQIDVEKNPEVKSAMMKQQLTQGMPNGMIRS